MVAPKNTTALEGTRVRLVCQAEAHPNNVTYQWFRDGVDVHLVTGLMARAGIYGDGSFIISSVQRSDTGWYRCQPTNGLGPPPSADAFLNVTCESDCIVLYSFIMHVVDKTQTQLTAGYIQLYNAYTCYSE